MTEHIDNHVLMRYSTVQKVGKGAYGIVWKAQDKCQDCIVALKKVFDAFNNITDAQRTYREVMFLRQMQHKNIIGLRNVYPSVNERDLYMIFDYMETDLHVAIRAKVLQQVHRRFIVYQVLKALYYMHSAGLIHRDLKPANILLDSECTAKLADFGLARSMGSIEDQDTVLTEYVATRWFRSPEILVGSRSYSEGVDMWSLGCIMGEMLLGKALFPGSSTLNQMQKISELIGSPTESDIQSFHNKMASEIFHSLPKIQTTHIDEIFREQATPDEVDLIKRLLVYDVCKRISVKEALFHPYVSQFLDKKELQTFQGQIKLELDDNKLYKINDYRDALYGRVSNNQSDIRKSAMTQLLELVQRQRQQSNPIDQDNRKVKTIMANPIEERSTVLNQTTELKSTAQIQNTVLNQTTEQIQSTNQTTELKSTADDSKKRVSWLPSPKVNNKQKLDSSALISKQSVSIQQLLQSKSILSPQAAQAKIITSPNNQANKAQQKFNYIEYISRFNNLKKQNNFNTQIDNVKLDIKKKLNNRSNITNPSQSQSKDRINIVPSSRKQSPISQFKQTSLNDQKTKGQKILSEQSWNSQISYSIKLVQKSAQIPIYQRQVSGLPKSNVIHSFYSKNEYKGVQSAAQLRVYNNLTNSSIRGEKVQNNTQEPISNIENKKNKSAQDLAKLLKHI